MPVGICKLCDRKRELVQSHIIPAWAYGPAMANAGYALKVGFGMSAKGLPVETGVFDKDLNCAECEGHFDNQERYAKTFLLDTDWASPASCHPDAPDQAHLLIAADATLLWRFFVGLLWKMSATTRPEFRSVRLGPVETEARAIVVSRGSDFSKRFCVIMSRFNGPLASHPVIDPRRAVVAPSGCRLGGVRCARSFFAGMTSFIKTDQQSFPREMDRFALRPSGPVVVLRREFAGSAELRDMVRLASGQP